MTTLRRIVAASLVLTSVVTFSGCKHHYKGYYRNYWRIPSHSNRSNTIHNTSDVTPQYRSPSPDPFYAQQAAKREANMRAVNEQNYRNQMQNYQKGYSNKLPNY
ncbi:MAG: hypothetical protein ABIP20_01460 [Chthoniobacteraceae bacterium]